MLRADRYWKHPFTAELYHLCSGKSPKHEDEAIVARLLEELGDHILVDFGIGGGRELSWINGVKTTRCIIGVDYAERILDKCQQIWKESKKPLVLVDDDFRDLSVTSGLIDDEGTPRVFMFLANTLGNLNQKERHNLLKKLALAMKKSDRVCLYLFKRPKTPVEIKEETGYYREHYCAVDSAVIKEAFGSEPRYYYDFENSDVVTACEDGPVITSHRWTKNEITRALNDAGLAVEKIIEGKHAFVATGRLAGL